jgi:hypothetical protein
MIKKMGITLDHETKDSEFQVYIPPRAGKKGEFDLAVALLNAHAKRVLSCSSPKIDLSRKRIRR